jgi:hypothetical protein
VALARVPFRRLRQCANQERGLKPRDYMNKRQISRNCEIWNIPPAFTVIERPDAAPLREHPQQQTI